MKEFFRGKDFTAKTLREIERAEKVIEEYAAQGYTLTLRQIYYQFVARDWIPNTVRSYDRLGRIINEARLAGMLDWYAIEDRTRNVIANAHWSSASSAIDSLVWQFRMDLWKDQPERVEVWIEKEALVGIIEETCADLDIPYFACRGYVSQSEQWRAYRRSDQHSLVILHFGDHDPSGIDMTRDNQERLRDVFGGRVRVIRLALNMDQIEQYGPPPNPAKMSDSRFDGYADEFGLSSWELDALEPSVINDLIRDNVEELIDGDAWATSIARQREQKRKLEQAVDIVKDDSED